ncbi:hypothetical protein GOP47_0027506 [Adiantum capillus-veneris]|nr:hypothetical protein GOP47_0027506 [Adiantum capillus-veneris]
MANLQDLRPMAITVNPELVQSPTQMEFWKPLSFHVNQKFKQTSVSFDCPGTSVYLQEPHPPWNWSKNHNKSSLPADGSGGGSFPLLLDPDISLDNPGLLNELQSQLQRCIDEGNHSAGEALQKFILQNDLATNITLANSLIRMHASFGNLAQANQIFRILEKPAASTWGAIISAHARLGEKDQAVALYHEMLNSGLLADGPLYVTVLKACSAAGIPLEIGMQVHAHTVMNGFESNGFVGGTLVDMYLKGTQIMVKQRKHFIVQSKWSGRVFNQTKSPLLLFSKHALALQLKSRANGYMTKLLQGV